MAGRCLFASTLAREMGLDVLNEKKSLLARRVSRPCFYSVRYSRWLGNTIELRIITKFLIRGT